MYVFVGVVVSLLAVYVFIYSPFGKSFCLLVGWMIINMPTICFFGLRTAQKMHWVHGLRYLLFKLLQ